MKKLRHLILSTAAIASACCCAHSQTTAAGMLCRTPSPGMFLVDSLTCLDMLDYYRSGSDRPSASIIGGKARVTGETPMKLSLRLGESSDYTIALLPASADTVVAVIETLDLTVPDSNIRFYDMDWQPVSKPEKIFKEPELKQWLTAEGAANRTQVEEKLPFMMWTADYEPETGLLTLTNTMDRYFHDDDREMLKPLLKEQITFVWNGKSFAPAKQ